MAEGKLVRQKGELTTTQTSLTSCLKKLLFLAAQSTGKDLMPGEERLWLVALAGKSPEQVTRGFRDFFCEPREDGVFMPKPQEILGLIERRGRKEAIESQWDETDRQMRENREAREAGKAMSFADWQKLLGDCVKKLATKIQRMPPVQDPEKEIVITPEKREIVRQQVEVVLKRYGKEQRV